MKIILFSVLLICTSFFSNAQSINETINFISEGIHESYKSAYEVLTYNRLSISAKGKITSDEYLDPKESYLMESRSGYLKNLQYSETKVIQQQNDVPVYVIILKCINGSNCLSRQVKTQNGDKVDAIAISVYNKELSEKIKAAMIHLLSLAKDNPDFLTKDIF